MKNPLPYLAAFLTQHNRQIVQAGVDFEWSPKSWTHNAFRVFELVFGRRAGIRAEVSVRKDLDGSAVYQFHTIESVIAHTESAIRALHKVRFPYRVWVPILQTPMGLPIPASPYLFAIAYVAGGKTGGSGGSTSPQSVSVTTSGSNTAMGFCSTTLNDTSTAPTYNSVSSTTASVATTYIGSGRFGARAYYLIAPTAGANNATFGTSPTTLGIVGFATQYSGCLQSGLLGNTGTNTAGTTNTIGVTVTVAATNSFILAWEIDSGASGGNSFSAGTNTNAIRVSDIPLAGCAFDGGPFATGSTTVNVTIGAGNATLLAAVAIEFKEAVASYTATPDLRSYFY